MTHRILSVILYHHHFDQQIHTLEGHYKVTQRMEIVKMYADVCYSYITNKIYNKTFI